MFRRLTIARRIAPVFCGSALKKRGLQPLLNMICDFLPAPDERHHLFLQFYRNHLCALAFKVHHDKNIGPLTYLRIYSGSVRLGSHFFNATRGKVPLHNFGKIQDRVSLWCAQDKSNLDKWVTQRRPIPTAPHSQDLCKAKDVSPYKKTLSHIAKSPIQGGLYFRSNRAHPSTVYPT